MELWRDGQYIDTYNMSSLNVAEYDATSDLCLGRRITGASNNHYLKGHLCDVSIHNQAIFPKMNEPLPPTTLVSMQLKQDCKNVIGCALARCENDVTFSTDEESYILNATSYINIHNVRGNLRLGNRGFTIQFRLRMDKATDFTLLAYESSSNYTGLRLRIISGELYVDFHHKKKDQNIWQYFEKNWPGIIIYYDSYVYTLLSDNKNIYVYRNYELLETENITNLDIDEYYTWKPIFVGTESVTSIASTVFKGYLSDLEIRNYPMNTTAVFPKYCKRVLLFLPLGSTCHTRAFGFVKSNVYCNVSSSTTAGTNINSINQYVKVVNTHARLRLDGHGFTVKWTMLSSKTDHYPIMYYDSALSKYGFYIWHMGAAKLYIVAHYRSSSASNQTWIKYTHSFQNAVNQTGESTYYLVSDNEKIEAYLDGKKVGSSDISSLNVAEWYTGMNFYVAGKHMNYEKFFDGRISDVSIRNYPVTPGNDTQLER